jgi:hypothetical protein
MDIVYNTVLTFSRWNYALLALNRSSDGLHK